MATWNIVGITPGKRPSAMPIVYDQPEATSQTFTLGAPVYINASGQIQQIANSGTTLFGIAVKAGQNGATDGAKTAKVYKIAPEAIFEGTLSVTSWNQSYVGSKVGLSQASSTWIFVTHTDYSAAAQAVVRGADSRIATGDSKPLVYVTFLHTMMQGEV